jgi:MFS transporter, DHA2 family, multidrug resistance protein
MLSAIGSGTVSKLPVVQQLDAVAIYMTFRQFGASIGVTLITTLLDRRETLHSSRLFELLASGSAATRSWMDTATAYALQRSGASTFQAKAMAVGLLADAGAGQAATLAYADAFLFMAAVGLIALCFVPLMSPTAAKK